MDFDLEEWFNWAIRILLMIYLSVQIDCLVLKEKNNLVKTYLFDERPATDEWNIYQVSNHAFDESSIKCLVSHSSPV